MSFCSCFLPLSLTHTLTHCQEYFIRSGSERMPLETWCSAFTQQKESRCYLFRLSQHSSLWHHAAPAPNRVTATWEFTSKGILHRERKYKSTFECKLDIPSRPAFTAGWPRMRQAEDNRSEGMRRRKGEWPWWKGNTGHRCPCCYDNGCSFINLWLAWKLSPFI